jgi:hypothetical protein
VGGGLAREQNTSAGMARSYRRFPAALQRPFDKLMKQLAIRLSYQTTIAKSLVIRANGLMMVNLRRCCFVLPHAEQ